MFSLSEHWNDVKGEEGNDDEDGNGDEDDEAEEEEIGKFKGVPLLPGWIITEELTAGSVGLSNKKKETFVWTARTPNDCLSDLKIFLEMLIEHLQLKYNEAVPDTVVEMGIFDLEEAISRFVKIPDINFNKMHRFI